MKKIHLHTTICLMLSCYYLMAQEHASLEVTPEITETTPRTYELSGVVTYHQQPIQNALIWLQGFEQPVVTTSAGKYHFSGVKKGDYQLLIVYNDIEKAVPHIVIENSDLTINFDIDTTQILPEFLIRAKRESSFGITRLKQVDGMAIYAGKKNDVILLDSIAANTALNNPRQVFSKVSGLNIWESDGAGIQLGIGGRGLNPSRVSNFNTRQNGYDISADALGYPESYYSPPVEAMQSIEIVRGAASLQYGTQFGGFINFKLKEGAEDKKVRVVSRQTVSSFNTFSSFNSIGGTTGKLSYFSFYQYKTGNGWRPNSHFDVHTAMTSLKLAMTQKLKIGVEYTFMYYLAQQPGGLTDAMFEANPRQSIRERNWFQVNWNLMALTADYEFSEKTKLNTRFFGLLAGRDALGVLGQITRADPLEARNLLKDDFRNVGNETRLLHHYDAFHQNAAFLVGIRYYRGLTYRMQGDGSDGYHAAFEYLNPDSLEHSDYTFPSQNVALFTENVFNITSKLSVTPGARLEYIDTRAGGYYRIESRNIAEERIYSARVEENRTNKRAFALIGLGVKYDLGENSELYVNGSQNYRAINFNNMRVVNPSFRVNPELKDEKGYTADLGWRGEVDNLYTFDVSVFLLRYKDRIGSVLKKDTTLFNTYRYRTNISDSRNMGIESFMEFNIWEWLQPNQDDRKLSLFSNISLIDARYINSEESAYEDNKVELAPSIIIKTGINVSIRKFQFSYQYSYTSQQYTDATNAVFTSNAVNGIIPSYYVMDVSAKYKQKHWALETGINNVANNSYFTRRAEGYPGPGIIPSDGRSLYLTLQVSF